MTVPNQSVKIALATSRNIPETEVDDRPLQRALQERGAATEWVNWDADVDWSQYDACLIRTTWDYMERKEEYLRWAQRVALTTQIYHPPGIVKWNLEKTYLRWFAERGFPVLPTEWFTPGEPVNLAERLHERGWRRAFLKPTVGATSRRTHRFSDNRAELARAQEFLDQALQEEGMMLQPYIAEVETEGEMSAIFIDGQLTHGVRKIPVPGDYRVQDNFGAKDEFYTFTDSELRLATDIVRACPFDLLYARADFLRTQGQLRMIELEIIEPSLFFRHHEPAATALANALLQRVRGNSKAF